VIIQGPNNTKPCILNCSYKVMLVGTCRTNRIGWPKIVMNLDKKSTRGEFKIPYCREARLAAFQWKDSKVVNCVSSYLNFSVTTIRRQVGSKKKEFPCPGSLKHYQVNMGGVDRGDQIRSHKGGFAAQSHFKKWYKKSLMAVLDCILLNASRMWNMSVPKVEGRNKLTRYEFLQCVAHELLHYKTEPMVSPAKGGARTKSAADEEDNEHYDDRNQAIHEIIDTKKDTRCVVCRLEWAQVRCLKNKIKARGREEVARQISVGNRRKCALCKNCGVVAHNHIVQKDPQFIHKYFPGKTCMEIFHSELGKTIWTLKNKKVGVKSGSDVVVAVGKAIEQHLGITDDDSAED
jgi:hypothetical protein